MDKLLFSDILEKEVKSGLFDIQVSFVWETPATVMRLQVADGTVLHLTVNLHAGETALFLGCPRAKEMQAAFRAYYIAHYIERLQTAHSHTPTSYFDGLVTLDALAVLHLHRTDTAVSPLARKSRRGLHPLHIACTRIALARVTETYALPQGEETEKMLAAYCCLPEVVYDAKGHAEFSALWAARTLKALLHNGVCTTWLPPQTATVADMRAANNDFWTHFLCSICLLSDTRISEEAYMAQCCMDFMVDCARWIPGTYTHRQWLLKDNRQAICELYTRAKRLQGGTEREQ